MPKLSTSDSRDTKFSNWVKIRVSYRL